MTTPTTRSSAENPPGTRQTDTFAMPENHLDVIVAPDSVDPKRRASLRTTIIAVVSMPLFFLVAFTLSYVSATHAPVPHDLAVTIAGPASTTDRIADLIDDEAENAFDVTETTDDDVARDAVTDREAVGALIIEGSDVTVLIASAEGRVATPVLQTLGDRVAEELGGTATVEDLAPLPSDDQGGTVMFFFLVICTVGAFLSITVISQSLPRSGWRPLLATSAGAALIAPVLGFSMISVYVDFEVTFGTIAGVIGVGMIYAFTVGLIASLVNRLLGQGGVLAVILLLVALNFPSAGGSVPASMLPPFWQGVHDLWIGGGAFEAMRSIMYFDGAQVGRWLMQLFIWTAAALVLIVVVAALEKRRASASLIGQGLEASISPAPTAATPTVDIVQPAPAPVDRVAPQNDTAHR